MFVKWGLKLGSFGGNSPLFAISLCQSYGPTSRVSETQRSENTDLSQGEAIHELRVQSFDFLNDFSGEEREENGTVSF